MATKYYRVLKDTPLWKEGAIISNKDTGYRPIEDIWDRVGTIPPSEYLSHSVIEHEDNADFFERVYPKSLADMVFMTAKQLADKVAKGFKTK